MTVLDTRKTPEGYILRRRVVSGGAINRTIEIPLDVWYAHYPPPMPPHKQTPENKLLALQMIQEGIKPAAIAHETGYSVSAIRIWMKGIKK